jgi:hypothetical protein
VREARDHLTVAIRLAAVIHEARSIALEHGVDDVVIIDSEHIRALALLQRKVVPDVANLPRAIRFTLTRCMQPRPFNRQVLALLSTTPNGNFTAHSLPHTRKRAYHWAHELAHVFNDHIVLVDVASAEEAKVVNRAPLHDRSWLCTQFLIHPGVCCFLVSEQC